MNKYLPLLLTLFILISLKTNLEAKIFSRCDLAQALHNENISRTFLSNWICLIEKESGRNSQAIQTIPKLRQASYGIFQISNKTYCHNLYKSGDCVLTCEALLDDNLKDDIQCAIKIWDKYGFKHWTKWDKECRGKELPDLKNCKI